jgi:hypothetical protein
MYRPSVAPPELSIRDGFAIGGYHRRLSSAAPSELSNSAGVKDLRRRREPPCPGPSRHKAPKER